MDEPAQRMPEQALRSQSLFLRIAETFTGLKSLMGASKLPQGLNLRAWRDFVRTL
jgi:hypothetical protein